MGLFPPHRLRHLDSGERIVNLLAAVDPDVVVEVFQRRHDILAIPLDLQIVGVVHDIAQAEHGEGSLAVAVSDDEELLEEIGGHVGEAADCGAGIALVAAPDIATAHALAEAFAPEHLELQGAAAEALAPAIRAAGCLFVGSESATAFGDYVAGSNHTLPTGGAARFASGLNVRHFRRRMSEVRIGPAAGALAPAGIALARAEGFDVHAASMAVRENGRP